MPTSERKREARLTRPIVAGCMVAAWVSVVAVGNAAELKAKTLAAWERYVAVTEVRMQPALDGEAPFLWVDRLAADDGEEAHGRLRAGEVVIERLETRENGDEIKVPDGKIHHWVGTVLIPGVTLDQTIALMQDYDRYAEIYGPDVRDAGLISQDGSRFHVYFQFYTKKVWTVVLNLKHDVEYRFLGDARAFVPSYSTRILEVEHPYTPDERVKPEGNDRGTMWRFNNWFLSQMYARFSLRQVGHRSGKTLRMCSCSIRSGAVVCRSVDGRLRGPLSWWGPARRQPDQTQAADSMSLTWRRTVKASRTRPRLSPTFYAGAEPSLTVQPPWNWQPHHDSAVCCGRTFREPATPLQIRTVFFSHVSH